MQPAFNTFLNLFLNYHRFNNMNEEAKAALKQEKWTEFIESESNAPKKQNVLSGLFSGKDSGNKLNRKVFEMKYKIKDQMEAMQLAAVLRAKILNIHGDEDMSDEQIENVKDALQMQLVGF